MTKKAVSKKAKASKPSFYKRNKLRLIFTGLAVVLAAVVVFMSESNKPLDDAQLLRRAIEHSISKQTATLTYVFETEFESARSVADVDYTDISGVVANIHESVSFPVGPDEQKSYDVELVAAADRIYAQLVHDDSSQQELATIDWNTWYYIDRTAGEDLLNNVFAFSDNQDLGILLATMLNTDSIATTHGEIPDGNFSLEQQAELLAVIDDRMPYVVQAAETVEIDGRSYREVELLIKGRGIDAVNDVVNQLTGQDKDLGDPFSRDHTINLFIDIEDESLYKFTTDEEDGDFSLTYSNYDQPVVLDTPDGAIDLEKLLEEQSSQESEVPDREIQSL